MDLKDFVCGCLFSIFVIGLIAWIGIKVPILGILMVIAIICGIALKNK